MSLTRHLKSSLKNSPVRRFFSSEFPNTAQFLREARKQVGQAETIRPEIDVPWTTMGTALDYRLRYYFDAAPNDTLVAYNAALRLSERDSRIPFDDRLSFVVRPEQIEFFDRMTGESIGWFFGSSMKTGGLITGNEYGGLGTYILSQAVPAILESSAGTPTPHNEGMSPGYGQFFADLDDVLQSTKPVKTRLAASDENKLNRYCIVLAELEEFRRSGRYRLASLGGNNGVTPSQFIELVEAHWIEDLKELSWLFYDRCSHLLTLPATLNPTFTGSSDIGGADADLIVDGTIIEIKSTVQSEIEVDYVRQLLGYVLLDYDDAHKISSVGLYMARQGLLFQWDLSEAIRVLSGKDSPDLQEYRACFKELLNTKPSS